MRDSNKSNVGPGRGIGPLERAVQLQNTVLVEWFDKINLHGELPLFLGIVACCLGQAFEISPKLLLNMRRSLHTDAIWNTGWQG